MPFSSGQGSAQAETGDRQSRSGGENQSKTSANGTDSASDPAGEFIEERLSRLGGVLGEDVLRKAQELRVFVLGCGRGGFLLILRLVMSGVGRLGGLVIADANHIELHNLDVMGLPPRLWDSRRPTRWVWGGSYGRRGKRGASGRNPE